MRNSGVHVVRVLRACDEQGPERDAVRRDRVVVRPPARSVVLDGAAERERDGRTDRGRVRAAPELDDSLVGVCAPSLHHEHVSRALWTQLRIAISRMKITAPIRTTAEMTTPVIGPRRLTRMRTRVDQYPFGLAG